MPTFAEQLTQYMQRVGITDAELARKIGVQRQTIFRWKEGTVGRPRVREDVLKCAESLRLTPAEGDQFLLAAGFAPEQPILVTPMAIPVAQSLPVHTPAVNSLEEAPPEPPLVEVLTTPLPQAHSRPLSTPWLLSLMLVSGLLILLVGGLWLYGSLPQIRRGG